MKSAHRIFVFLLLWLACAYGQMTVISGPTRDPELKPEQRTPAIMHYEQMRVTARISIRVLALALQNTESGGPKARLNEAINNEEDIVDWANWCIQALRDKSDNAATCSVQPSPNEAAGSQSACQLAGNSVSHGNCSPRQATVKRSLNQ